MGTFPIKNRTVVLNFKTQLHSERNRRLIIPKTLPMRGLFIIQTVCDHRCCRQAGISSPAEFFTRVYADFHLTSCGKCRQANTRNIPTLKQAISEAVGKEILDVSPGRADVIRQPLCQDCIYELD